MKRVVLFILLVLVCAGSVQASLSTVLNEYVAYNHEFTDSGNTYSLFAPDAFRGDDDRNQLLLSKNGRAFIIDYNDCVDTLNYQYCYRNTTFDSGLIDSDENNKIQPAIFVTIKERDIETTLDIDTSFSLYTVDVDDEITVNIAVDINDEQTYRNIKLTETVPSGFKIINASELTITGNTLSATLQLENESRGWAASYLIKAVEPGQYTFQTQATYDNDDSRGLSIASDQAVINILEPYRFEANIGEKILVDSVAEFGLNLINNENKTLFADIITITVPELPVTRFDNLIRTGKNTYYAAGNVAPDATQLLEIQMNAAFPGEYDVTYSIEGRIGEENFTTEETVSFIVTTKDVACYFRTTNANPVPGDKVIVTAYLQNQEAEVTEVSGILTSPNGEDPIGVDRIVFGDEKDIGSYVHTFAAADDEFEVAINLTYLDSKESEASCFESYTFSASTSNIQEIETTATEEETPSETEEVEVVEVEQEETTDEESIAEEEPEETEVINTFEPESEEEEAPAIVEDVEEEPEGFFAKIFALVKSLF